MKAVFEILEKFSLLKDAQLFRYHVDKHGSLLADVPSIEHDDIEKIENAAWSIRQRVLECIHSRKGYSI